MTQRDGWQPRDCSEQTHLVQTQIWAASSGYHTASITGFTFTSQNKRKAKAN